MAHVRQLVLAALGAALALAPDAGARRFYDDDPLQREPAPLRVEQAHKHGVNEYVDFFRQTFSEPDKDLRRKGQLPASGAVNTAGEVPDSAWYQNRHPERMSIEELKRGPGESNAPSVVGPWTVLSGKNEGIALGLIIRDARGKTFFVKFDPKSNPEMATAADVVGARFFWALGYNVPENHIVRFARSRLRLKAQASFRDPRGQKRLMTERDIDDLLERVPVDSRGRYRGIASFKIPGELLGPFDYTGTRPDDPNDIVPHENRRDLRGLYVFAAWLNHSDAKSVNTLDSLVEENGLRYIKHYLIDFGSILGSDTYEAKDPRIGSEYMFDPKPDALAAASFGLWVPCWARARYPKIPAVGRFTAECFDPEQWKPNYPNTAFDNRLPGDTYWAAKKVMVFTDQQIRALVETGEYSDPRAVDWITRALVRRRDMIGRAFFNDVLPLDGFAARNGRLEFEDLAARYGFAAPRALTVRWARFDDETGQTSPLTGTTFALPAELQTPGAYAAAHIEGGDARKTITVYLRNRAGRVEVAGIDRTW